MGEVFLLRPPDANRHRYQSPFFGAQACPGEMGSGNSLPLRVGLRFHFPLTFSDTS